jgi:hypothetical protein
VAAKSTARKATARKSAARRTGKRASARRRTGGAAASTAAASRASAAGSADLAGGLRSFLSSIEAEVRAVSALSERIDALVTDLNARRDEQSKRLLVLDALQTSVNDAGLSSFLDKAIRPRRARVQEVVPKRLTQ